MFDDIIPFKQEDYMYNTMDMFPAYNTLPFHFYDPSATAESQDLKYEMSRSASQGSMFHPRHMDLPPALQSSASGPSIPSASSSTVGSPYSGHIHTVPIQDMYTSTAAANFMAGPAIVCDDGYSHDFAASHYDPEAAFVQDSKLSGAFVGECADLSSSVQRSSKMPVKYRLSASDLLDTSNSSPPTRESPEQLSATHGVFKSPTTPASAYPRTPSNNSPVLLRGHATSLSHSSSSSSSSSSSTSSPSHLQPMQQNATQTSQYHFFSQSSGSFMPPIESSCSSFLDPTPFSYPSLSLIFHIIVVFTNCY